MLRFLAMDWVAYLFNGFAVWMYEKEQEKHRKYKQNEKKKIIKNNRIIVKVNSEVIYDSKKEKDMSDDLYYALLSYGLMDSVNLKAKKSKSPISYNIMPSISTMPYVTNAKEA